MTPFLCSQLHAPTGKELSEDAESMTVSALQAVYKKKVNILAMKLVVADRSSGDTQAHAEMFQVGLYAMLCSYQYFLQQPELLV